MKKYMFRKITALLLVTIMLTAMAPMASAYYHCEQTVITSAADGHVDKIMADLDRQSFESEAQRESAKAAVRHLLSGSSYAALRQSSFPYPNRNGYAETVNDGTYSFTVRASGCYAYAKWASQVVYGAGKTGVQTYVKDAYGNDITSVWGLTSAQFKDFVRDYCQAGEHMRIDYVHSICFLACSDEGVYFVDYAGDSKPVIRLCYASYDALFNAVRTGSSFWLSDVVTMKNGDKTPEAGENADVSIKLSIDKPDIYVNGEHRYIDAEGTTPIIYNNRTMLPIRAVVEAMGGEVGWNGEARIVSLTLGDKQLFLKIDSYLMWDDTAAYSLDTPPIIFNGRTLVPVRAVVEYFGAIVGWDNDTRTVTIDYYAE